MGTAHMAEFLDAVRNRKQPGCTIQDGYQSTTAVKLAMIAYEVGEKVTWDSQREQITSSERAHALLRREYRAPWQHPYQARAASEDKT